MWHHAVVFIWTSFVSAVIRFSAKRQLFLQPGRPSFSLLFERPKYFAPSAPTPANYQSRDGHTGWITQAKTTQEVLMMQSYIDLSTRVHRCKSKTPNDVHLNFFCTWAEAQCVPAWKKGVSERVLDPGASSFYEVDCLVLFVFALMFYIV